MFKTVPVLTLPKSRPRNSVCESSSFPFGSALLRSCPNDATRTKVAEERERIICSGGLLSQITPDTFFNLLHPACTFFLTQG